MTFVCINGALANSRAISFSGFNNIKVKSAFINGDFKYGIYMYNNTNQYNSSTISGCSCVYGRNGIYLDNGSTPASGAEYVEIIGCVCSSNTETGLTANAGNVAITGGNFNGNFIGIKYDGTTPFYNPDHGRIVGATVNHNVAVGIYCRNLKYGLGIIGCQVWATNGPGTYSGFTNATARLFTHAIYMENSVAVNIIGNSICRNKGTGVGLDGWAECNISNNIFSSDASLAFIWETGEVNSVYSCNCFNVITNNIFQYAMSAGGVKDNISLMDTVNSKCYKILGNRGSSFSHLQYMNTAGLTYYLANFDNNTINAGAIQALATSTTPADQSTNIYIQSCMIGEFFTIYFNNPIFDRCTWVRVKTTSSNLPTLAFSSSSKISYFLAYKAFKIVNLEEVYFSPMSSAPLDWIVKGKS